MKFKNMIKILALGVSFFSVMQSQALQLTIINKSGKTIYAEDFFGKEYVQFPIKASSARDIRSSLWVSTGAHSSCTLFLANKIYSAYNKAFDTTFNSLSEVFDSSKHEDLTVEIVKITTQKKTNYKYQGREVYEETEDFDITINKPIKKIEEGKRK